MRQKKVQVCFIFYHNMAYNVNILMGFNAFSLFGAYNSSITARWAVVSEILRLLEVRELAVLDWFFQESQLS